MLASTLSSKQGAQKLAQSPFDTFERRCGFNDDLRELILNFAKKIEGARFIGQGAEAKVYDLENGFVARIDRTHRLIDYQEQNKTGYLLSNQEASFFKNEKFKILQDNFGGRNFGQPLAESEDGLVQIARKVVGNKMYVCGSDDPQIYMKKLENYANLPDETLEAFIKDVAFINQKGYRIDQNNPENFLYDITTKRIGIVDIAQKEEDLTIIDEPFGHDWIVAALVNEHDVHKVYRKASRQDRQKMLRTIKRLEERIIPICKKQGVPISKWNSRNYLPTSILNVLEQQKVDYSYDLLGQIIYDKYPNRIKSYEKFLKSNGLKYKL